MTFHAPLLRGCTLFVLLAGASAVQGQTLFFDRASRAQIKTSTVLKQFPAGSDACANGVVYDDGSFEQPVTVPGLATLDAVMSLNIPASSPKVSKMCLCWTRLGGPSTVDFDLLFYRGNGTEGRPGDLLFGLAGLKAEGIPLYPQTAYYAFDAAQQPFLLPAGKVFLGASWDAEANPQVFLCGDETTNTPRPSFFSADLGETWEDLGGQFLDLRALGARTVTSPVSTFTCAPGPTTLCLNQGRFQVRVDWSTATTSGAGNVVPFGSNDSGLFYFFNPDNWEMLVKVIDGCALNNRYWVFYAALTNVQLTITVTDSATGGAPKIYTNPLNRVAQPVTDTDAFACN